MLENRAQAERGEKSEGTDDQDDGDQQEREKRRRDRERAGRFGHDLLARQIAGNRQDRNVLDETAEKRGEAERLTLNQSVFPLRPAKADPLLPVVDV